MRLAEWRKQQGYSQQQLADLLGIAQPQISRFERAHDPELPKPSTVVRIWSVTKGAVAPNDFYALPPIGQAELPLPAADSAPLLEAAQQ